MMNEELEHRKRVIKCAFADLIGVVQAKQQGDLNIHDWDNHMLSIHEMFDEFSEEYGLVWPTNIGVEHG